MAAQQGSYCLLKKPKKKLPRACFRKSSVVCNESDIDHQIRMKIHLSGICAFMVDF